MTHINTNFLYVVTHFWPCGYEGGEAQKGVATGGHSWKFTEINVKKTSSNVDSR